MGCQCYCLPYCLKGTQCKVEKRKSRAIYTLILKCWVRKVSQNGMLQVRVVMIFQSTFTTESLCMSSAMQVIAL